MAKGIDPAWIMVIIVGILAASQLGYIGLPAATTDGTSGPTITVSTGDGCSGISSSTMTLNIWDKYTVTTSRDGEHVRVILDGADQGQKIDGSTLSVAPDQAYRLYGSENSSGNNVYYTQKLEGVMPCKDLPLSFHVAVNGTPAFTYWDLNAAANTAVDLTTDDTKVVDFRWRASSKKAFGNPYLIGKCENVMCFAWNTSNVLNAELVGATAAPIPKLDADMFGQTGHSSKCFYWQILENNEDYLGKVQIETTSTGPTTGFGHINVSIHDCDYDLNADTLAEIIGVEDEDRNDVGMAIVHSTILVT